MTVVYLLLMIGAVVCFAAAAFRVASPRVELVALGLALWALVGLIQLARVL